MCREFTADRFISCSVLFCSALERCPQLSLDGGNNGSDGWLLDQLWLEGSEDVPVTPTDVACPGQLTTSSTLDHQHGHCALPLKPNSRRYLFYTYREHLCAFFILSLSYSTLSVKSLNVLVRGQPSHSHEWPAHQLRQRNQHTRRPRGSDSTHNSVAFLTRVHLLQEQVSAHQ